MLTSKCYQRTAGHIVSPRDTLFNFTCAAGVKSAKAALTVDVRLSSSGGVLTYMDGWFYIEHSARSSADAEI